MKPPGACGGAHTHTHTHMHKPDGAGCRASQHDGFLFKTPSITSRASITSDEIDYDSPTTATFDASAVVALAEAEMAAGAHAGAQGARHDAGRDGHLNLGEQRSLRFGPRWSRQHTVAPAHHPCERLYAGVALPLAFGSFTTAGQTQLLYLFCFNSHMH